MWSGAGRARRRRGLRAGRREALRRRPLGRHDPRDDSGWWGSARSCLRLGYLARIRAHCDEAGALWIADEVLTGFGRVARALRVAAHSGSAVRSTVRRPDSAARPDVIVFGKGAGAGFAPLAGVLDQRSGRASTSTPRASHTHQTYGGNPIACAVGRRVLRAMAEEMLDESVRAAEPWLEDALRHLARTVRAVRQVRGLGYLWGSSWWRTADPASRLPAKRRVAERIAESCRDRGVLVHAGTSIRPTVTAATSS